ncbi:MAG: mechanosensitive ion channel [Hyphomicrobiales bacterium]|nr:mechanosensitive ion channel [Hyphomicrobiales bacterium]
MHIVPIIRAFAISLILALSPVDAFAQSSGTEVSVPAEVDEHVTQQNITEFVSTLNKEEIDVLNKLLNNITNKRANTESSKTPIEKVEFGQRIKTGWYDYSSFMWDNISALPVAIDSGFQALGKIAGERGAVGNLLFAGFVALALFAGFVAEFATHKFTKTWRETALDQTIGDSGFGLRSFSRDIAVELLKMVVFVVAALVATKLLITNQSDQFLMISFILYALFGVRTTEIFLRFVLAPKTPEKRLVSIDVQNANFIYRNFLMLASVVGVGLFFVQIMNHYQIGGIFPFRFWIGQFIHISLLYMMWRARKGIASIIRGEDQNLTPGLERMAIWWPIISMILITVQVFIMQLGSSTGVFKLATGTGILTVLLIVFVPFFDTMLRSIISQILPKMQGEGEVAELAYYETRNSYLRIGRILLLTLIFGSVGKLWGIDYANLAQLGFGAQIAAKGGGFLLILAIGYLAWEMTKLWVNHQLAKDASTDDVQNAGESEGGGVGRSRLASVLPLVSMAVQTAIVVLTVLLGLSQLGINITPLLAGAGVFGIAIGFGAQALVKDVVSGVFFLWDDAFRLGEYIDIGGTVGTVEKISVRSLQLRHPNGPVHVIPYGEIPKLTNHSRDYVIMKLRFTVPFDTDLEKVRRLFKKIGQEMMENPALAGNFIQPFKSQGAADVDDVGIVIRGKFTTKPGAQWAIRKEVYSRVQKAFEENGISFARREVRVQIPGLDNDSDLKPGQKQAVAAAVGEAVNVNTDKKNVPRENDDPF